VSEQKSEFRQYTVHKFIINNVISVLLVAPTNCVQPSE
jgi:hypothetical protein